MIGAISVKVRFRQNVKKPTREKINDTDPKNIYSMLQPSHL